MNISKQRLAFLFVLVLFVVCQGVIEGRINSFADLETKQIQNPVFNLPVFDLPNGAQSGKLIFGKKNRKSGVFDNIQFLFENGDIFDAENVMFFPSLDEKKTIVYKQERDGFYEILSSGKFMWIRSTDLTNLNVQSISLESYLEAHFKKDNRLYLDKIPVALRSGSGNGFRKVLDLSGSSFELIYKGQKVNNWIKVVANKYTDPICYGESRSAEFSIEGWVELFDESGDLKIQLLPKRCL